MSSSNPAGPYAAGNPSTSKRVPPVASGLYPAESVKNAAESIGISKLDDRVAATLAGDVEFRIHQVIEEAQKFMRHSKRLTMLPTDINHALEALNVEPLYGHLPIPSSSQPAFVPLKLADTAKKSSNKEQFYYLQDKEIDFAQLLAQKPPALTGGGVRWTAHWLAVEGVMPRVPENVAPNYRAGAATSAAVADSGTAATATTTANGTKGGSVATAAGAGGVSSAPGAANKVPLSQELQLYFSRLTRALLPNAGAESSVIEAGGDPELSPAERSRLAALASLRADTGLQGLVAYLVRWIGEKISDNLVHLPNLPPLLDMIHALLSNQTLFLEPYLHQLLPPLLSPLLTYPLASSPPTPSGPTASTIRAHAAEVLAVLTAEFGSVYESLIPRLTKTLLKSTELPAPAGRVEGALRGLAAIGKEGAKRGIWGVEREMSDTEGVRALGATWEAQASWSAEEKGAVAKAGVSILHLLLPVPRPTYHLPLPVARPSESFDKLLRAFGPLIGDALAEDRWLADRLLALIAGQELPAEEEAKIVDPSAFLSHPQRSSPPLPAPVPGPSAWDAPPPPPPPAAVDQGEDHLATMDDDDEDADMEEFEA